MNTTLLDEFTGIFRTVFEDDALTIGTETTASDVYGWDSLQHVSLILATEHHFGLRFTSTEVANLKSVGDILEIITARGRNPK